MPIRDLIISGMLFSILGNSLDDFLNFFDGNRRTIVIPSSQHARGLVEALTSVL